MNFTFPKIQLFVFILICCTTHTACKKLLHVNPPGELVTGQTVFSNDSSARAAVTGIYIKIMSNPAFLLNGGLSIYTSLSADDIVSTSFSQDELQFANNNLSPDNRIILINFWQHAYSILYQANSCLEHLASSESVNILLRKQLMGEVKFIRATCYFYLIQLFGDVPLVTSSKLEDNLKPRRTPVADILLQIKRDLTDAWTDLPLDGPNTLPNKLSAAAMLARLYCSQQTWDQAETFSSAVIDLGKYSLTPDLVNTFLRESPETILQFATDGSNNSTAEGLFFIPASPNHMPTYILTDSLMAAFEPNDRRKTVWTNSVSIGDQVFHYPYKYKTKRSDSAPNEYNIVIRLAELYLTRAEARVHQGKFTGAINDINIIRARAGLNLVTLPLSQNDLLFIIERERQIELFTEFGHRWIDLNRTGRAHDVLSAAKGHKWQLPDHLYPIPQSEIKLNPNLSQNPGY